MPNAEVEARESAKLWPLIRWRVSDMDFRLAVFVFFFGALMVLWLMFALIRATTTSR